MQLLYIVANYLKWKTGRGHTPNRHWYLAFFEGGVAPDTPLLLLGFLVRVLVLVTPPIYRLAYIVSAVVIFGIFPAVSVYVIMWTRSQDVL